MFTCLFELLVLRKRTGEPYFIYLYSSLCLPQITLPLVGLKGHYNITVSFTVTFSELRKFSKTGEQKNGSAAWGHL